MKTLVQVRGCMEVDYEGSPHVEEVADEFAEFFGVYIQDEDGFMIWHSDYDTREDAEEAAEDLGILV